MRVSVTLVALLISIPVALSSSAAFAGSSKSDRTRRYGELPLYFETNRGQVGSHYPFLSRGQGYCFLLGPAEALIALDPEDCRERDQAPGSARCETPRTASQRHAFRMQFLGASTEARLIGQEELAGKVNYLLGNDPTQWHRDLSTFAQVRYEDLYPGVDLLLYGNQGQLEYDFIVAPGANLDPVSFRFEGVERLEVDRQGDLIVYIPGGQLRQRKPLIYQNVAGHRREIVGGYVLRENHTVSFYVENYDCSQPLVIDPVLGYSTYFGGRNRDRGWDVAVEGNGDTYITGETLSLNFPATPGAYRTNYAGGFVDETNFLGGDAFVAKLDSSGSKIFTTYIGGRGDDGALGIALLNTSTGTVSCLTGFTDSPDFPLAGPGPGTNGPLQRTLRGTPDQYFGIFPFEAFVAQLDPSGSSLSYSSYLGGAGVDEGVDIAVDGNGNLYVTGFTQSPDFPNYAQGLYLFSTSDITNAESFLTQLKFGRLNRPGGTADLLSQFLTNLFSPATLDLFSLYTTGMVSMELEQAVLNDINQLIQTTNIYDSARFAGVVVSSSAKTLLNLEAEGPALVRLNRLLVEEAYGLPRSPTALQTLLNLNPFPLVAIANNYDAFVTKIDPSAFGANALIYSTFLGSTFKDAGDGITVDAAGNAYVTGTMDLRDPIESPAVTHQDVFVTKLNPAGTALVYGQQLHGAGTDWGFRINLDSANNAFLTGSTDSGDFPATPNSLNQGGVFKSVDAGATWALSSVGLTRGLIRSLAVDPANSAIVYAGTASGVFTSTDAGSSWFNDANNLKYFVVTTTITYTNYIITNNNVRCTNVVFYTNELLGGPSFWLRSPNALGFNPVASIAADQNGLVYAGTLGGGVFTNELPTVPVETPICATNVDLTVTDVKGNIIKAESSWFRTKGLLPNSIVNALAVDPVMPAIVYAGTSGGLFKSTNRGGLWFASGLGFPLIKSLAIAPDASVLYVGSSSGIARTRNRGTNWTLVNVGLANFFVNALALDPNAPNIVYAGTDAGLYRSLNAGTNWVAVTNFSIAISNLNFTLLGTNRVAASNLVVSSLATAAGAPATLYAGTPLGLLQTIDQGTTWTVLTNGLPARKIVSLAVDPNSPNVIYAGTGSTNFFGKIDCFITKVSSDGTGLPFSTVVGGSGDDTGWDVAVDSQGNVFVAGGTSSTNFLVTSSPIYPDPQRASGSQATNSGGFDAFVLELDPAGSAFVYSFYLGGKADDVGHGIALDSAGNTYVIGQTGSTTNFPLMTPLQGTNAGSFDLFLTKIPPVSNAVPPNSPPPKLLAARSGNSIVLSWRAPAIAFELQVNNNGMHSDDWSPVSQTPSTSNGTNTVILSASGGHQTFRLKRK